MNDEDRILEDIKEILKELDEQGRMKYTQRYMQHSDISVYKHCISVAYTSVELIRRNRREEMEIAGIAIDETVDITDKVCPLTFVKAKVALEELDDGEVIAIRMNDGEPVQNVPRSVKEEGHQILKLVDNEDGTYNLIVRKVEG